jgi:hypothetical protein
MMARSSVNRCRIANCAALLRSSSAFYCPSHWDALLDGLVATIEPIAREAREIYIGRSNDPERRLLEHYEQSGRDLMAVLHWSSDQEEIEIIEKELIERTSRFRKQANESSKPHGSWYGHWNAVYLSWMWRAASRGLPSLRFKNVDGLYHPRLLPDCGRCPKPPDYLRATLSPEDATRILDELDEARAERRLRRKMAWGGT